MQDSSGFRVFVVEDDPYYQKLLVYNLNLDADLEVSAFGSGKELLSELHKMPHLITVDYNLPDMKGGELLQRIHAFNPEIAVVMVSEQDSIETAVDLLRMGAFDYVVKGDNLRDRLHSAVRHARKQASMQQTIANLRAEVGERFSFGNTIIGQSAAIKQVFSIMEKALNTNINVSVNGETGTGKEVVAKAIHYSSTRKDQPFVAVNVSAIPAELVESELFGHERGAFTGAQGLRIGKFEQAKQGTLFLDEIAEMELPMQAKLLRVLQEREVVRVGGNKSVKVDCRIVIATHRNLMEMVQEGSFREDLYYRLLGLQIQLPPLRERGNDVVLLAKHFIDLFCKENDLRPKKLTEAACQKLLNYPFPGNIRELRSVVDLAVVLSENDEIEPEHLTLQNLDNLSGLLMQEKSLKEYTNDIIRHFLNRYDNNVLLVADKLDIGKSTIYRLLKQGSDE